MARLRRTASLLGLVACGLIVANVIGAVAWSARNPCLRSHTEIASHPDPYGSEQVIEVCDWYEIDPARNPWHPRNEWRTLKRLFS